MWTGEGSPRRAGTQCEVHDAMIVWNWPAMPAGPRRQWNFLLELAFSRYKKMEDPFQIQEEGKDYGSILQVRVRRRRTRHEALKSGRSGKSVKSKKQAIAIGLSEARAKGKKVPNKKSA